MSGPSVTRLAGRAAFALMAALAATVTGCESPSGLSGVTVRMSDSLYTAGTMVAFTVLNNGTSVVYLSRCCSHATVEVDRWQGAEWASYRSGACLALCPVGSVEIPPRIGRVDTTATIPDTGRYRLLVGVAPAAGAQPEWVASNDFQIR